MSMVFVGISIVGMTINTLEALQYVVLNLIFWHDKPCIVSLGYWWKSSWKPYHCSNRNYQYCMVFAWISPEVIFLIKEEESHFFFKVCWGSGKRKVCERCDECHWRGVYNAILCGSLLTTGRTARVRLCESFVFYLQSNILVQMQQKPQALRHLTWCLLLKSLKKLKKTKEVAWGLFSKFSKYLNLLGFWNLQNILLACK